MVAGFIMIASLTSSLAPRARSQSAEAPPPVDWQPDPTQMLETPPAETGGPSEIPAVGNPEAVLEIPEVTSDPIDGAPPLDSASGEQLPLRQDPFMPMLFPSKPSPKVQVSTPGEPLPENGEIPSEEFFDPNDPFRMHFLKDYKLTGVLWSNSSPKAMFLSPEGGTLTVRRKSVLGREGAVVITVRESEVLFLVPGPGKNYENGTVKILSLRK